MCKEDLRHIKTSDNLLRKCIALQKVKKSNCSQCSCQLSTVSRWQWRSLNRPLLSRSRCHKQILELQSCNDTLKSSTLIGCFKSCDFLTNRGVLFKPSIVCYSKICLWHWLQVFTSIFSASKKSCHSVNNNFVTVNFDEEVASLPTSIHASEADDRIPRFGDYFLKVFWK